MTRPGTRDLVGVQTRFDGQFKARLDSEAGHFVDGRDGPGGPRGARRRGLGALGLGAADRGKFGEIRKSVGWDGHAGAGRAVMEAAT
jgi:hypothetical protein